MLHQKVVFESKGKVYKGYIDNVYTNSSGTKVDILFETGQWVNRVPQMALIKNPAWSVFDEKVSLEIMDEYQAAMDSTANIYLMSINDKGTKRRISVLANDEEHAVAYIEKDIDVRVISVQLSRNQIPEMYGKLIKAA